MFIFFFFFNDTATTEIYTLSLHDALPILVSFSSVISGSTLLSLPLAWSWTVPARLIPAARARVISLFGSISSTRSEEHTSELQSRQYLVCRLLLEKKKKQKHIFTMYTIHT